MSRLNFTRLRRVYKKFSLLDRLILGVFTVVLIVSGIIVAGELQQRVSTAIPAEGGELVEGVVGFPRYINPVLATTNADRDLSALVYAGLMKLDQEGNAVPDLAEEMSVSDDGLIYTFTIQEDARFHDGHPVRAEDVVYTINKVKDQQVNSPHQDDWGGVSVESDGPRTVRFILSENFGGFVYNTTIGILPKHLWEEESVDSFPFASRNTNPVGAGPYRVVETNRNAEGVPTEYELTNFQDYHQDTPPLETITVKFFADNTDRQQAFNQGEIEATYGINPGYAKDLSDQGERVTTHTLRRVFSVFFNQNRNEALVDLSVRRALATAIPKHRVVEEALSGYGSAIDAPSPDQTIQSEDETLGEEERLEQANQQLESAGWTMEDGVRTKDGQSLDITLTTANISTLNNTADIISNQWEELGINVNVDAREISNLSRNVIRPRQYETLLFGQSINHNDNLYPFWHSSSREDPGLNLSMYTSVQADDILTNLRQTRDREEATELREQFFTLVKEDQPAAFVFSPDFIYVVPDELENMSVPPLTVPADRFTQVGKWYTETDRLWNIFTDSAERAATSTN